MRINKQFCLGAGICALAAAALASPLWAEEQNEYKFDAAIRLAMSSPHGARLLSAMTCAKGESEFADGVRVLAKTDDKGAQITSYLAQNGGRVNSRHGGIVSMTMPYSALPGLAKLDSVSYIEASKPVHSCNDVAAGDEAGVHLASMLAKCPSYDGKGVVVGVIDTGIDTLLGAFQDEDGNSRISYYWNMEVNNKSRYPTVVTPEGDSRTYSYGSEYTAADIADQVGKRPVCTDEYGHGTHVCGIIGGRDEKYPGMAPGVNFIVVNNTTEDGANEDDIWLGAGTGSTLDALEYIISRAEEMGMPLVVNISQGTNLGPHDGSTLFEQAIQADIEERGLIVCIAAGNEQDAWKNAKVTVPAGGSESVSLSAELFYTEDDSDWLPGAVDIWSTGNPELDMTVSAGDVQREIAYKETIDEYEDLDGINLGCFKEFSSPLNGDDHFLINLLSQDDGGGWIILSSDKNKANGVDDVSSDDGASDESADGDASEESFDGGASEEIGDGDASEESSDEGVSDEDSDGGDGDDEDDGDDEEYDDEGYRDVTITFTNKGSEDATVHLYLQRNTDSIFYDHVEEGGSIGIPGSTPGAITVGAYITRDGIEDEEGYYDLEQTVGEITGYSSQGPMRTDKLYKGVNAVKPDIVAPGSMLISQMATGYWPFFDFVIDDTHIAFEGTSMSTPVVTGIVALMLQNMPDASPEQIKEAIFDKASSDKFTGTVPNSIYGHGKLNAACLESSRLVSPQPKISAAGRSFEDAANLVIKGSCFTPAADIYVNGILWDASLVKVDGSALIIVKDVYDGPAPAPSPSASPGISPFGKKGVASVERVKVVNRLGRSGANSDEFVLDGKPVQSISERHGGSGGCFIATAAYGSYLEPEVMTLRRFRDRSLITNAPGRAFVKLYYTYSPPAADFIAAHPGARLAARAALTPLVFSVSHPGTALTLALLLGAAGGAVYRRRRIKAEKAG